VAVALIAVVVPAIRWARVVPPAIPSTLLFVVVGSKLLEVRQDEVGLELDLA
jgi:hypothetical protein